MKRSVRFAAGVLAAVALTCPRRAPAFSTLFDAGGDAVEKASLAPRWSAEPDPFGGGTGLHDGIQVAVDANFAANLGAAEVATLYGVSESLVDELVELAVRRAFQMWETGVLHFDVAFGGPAVVGTSSGLEIDLFASPFPDQFFGFTDVNSLPSATRLLTNGQRVAGDVIIGADVFINTSRLLEGAQLLHQFHVPLELLGAALQILVAHEVGHAIGLGHPNQQTFLDTDTDPYNEMIIDPFDPFHDLIISSIPLNTPGALLPIMWGGLSSSNPSDLLLLLGRLNDPQLTSDDRGGCDVLYPTDLPPAPIACAPAPQPDCAKPVVPLKSLLAVKNGTLLWKWNRGAGTSSTQFGDPVKRNSYALCVYGDTDVTPTLWSEMRVPGGGLCAGKPCWKGKGNPAGSTGWKYHDKDLTPTGLLKVILKPGASGKARIRVKGKGTALPLPPMPIVAFPLRVQLQGPVRCWETQYEAADVVLNTADTLKLKGPKP